MDKKMLEVQKVKHQESVPPRTKWCLFVFLSPSSTWIIKARSWAVFSAGWKKKGNKKSTNALNCGTGFKNHCFKLHHWPKFKYTTEMTHSISRLHEQVGTQGRINLITLSVEDSLYLGISFRRLLFRYSMAWQALSFSSPASWRGGSGRGKILPDV